jgi:hypothetical protein
MRRALLTLIAAALAWLGSVGAARADFIVNIGGAVSGFAYPSTGVSVPLPKPGDTIIPVGALTQLTLPAGTFEVTNATGLPGANPSYTAYNFNVNQSPSWDWRFVIAAHGVSTDTVLLFGEAGTIESSQAAVAAEPEVQHFSATFTLTATTTLDFTVQDYFLPDNAGGVALRIAPTAVPEPASLGLFGVGAPLAAGYLARRRARPRTV